MTDITQKPHQHPDSLESHTIDSAFRYSLAHPTRQHQSEVSGPNPTSIEFHDPAQHRSPSAKTKHKMGCICTSSGSRFQAPLQSPFKLGAMPASLVQVCSAATAMMYFALDTDRLPPSAASRTAITLLHTAVKSVQSGELLAVVSRSENQDPLQSQASTHLAFAWWASIDNCLATNQFERVRGLHAQEAKTHE